MISASKVFFNGNLVSSNGHFSTNPDDEVPGVGFQKLSLRPKIGDNNLVIQISNFHHYFGGGAGIFKVSRPEVLIKSEQFFFFRDTFITGALFIMMFYHLYMWTLRKSLKAPLYFALICLTVGIRGMVVGTGEIIYQMIPTINFEIAAKVEYLGFCVGVGLFSLMINQLYPHEFKRREAYTITAISGLWAIIILLTNSMIFPIFLKIYQPIAGIAAIYAIIAVGFAFARKRDGSFLFLIGYSITAFATIYDILAALDLAPDLFITHVGVFLFIICQALILCYTFNKAFDRAEDAEAEVKNLNRSLEQQVKERTRTIKTILDNVSSGFLLVNEAGNLLPGYSNSCLKILDCPLTANHPILDQIEICRRDKMSFDLAIDQVFTGKLPISISLDQIPKRLAHKQKMLSIHAAEVRNQADDAIESILFTITDITELEVAEKQISENEAVIAIMGNQEAFLMFLKDLKTNHLQFRQMIAKPDLLGLKSSLHTLKGNLRSFNLNSFADQVHHFEGLSKIKVSELDQFMSTIFDFSKKYEHIFNIDINDLSIKGRFIFKAEIETLTKALASENDTNRQVIKEVIKSLSFPTIKSMTGPLVDIATSTAQYLEKDIKIKITGDSIRIEEAYRPVLRNIIHLVNNAIDHGIPADRDNGIIKIDFFLNKDSLNIVVSDNGTGLNSEKIVATAKKKGLIQEAMTYSEDEIHSLIFHADFSTSTSITTISGRGFGLAALLNSVKSMDGTIAIESVKNKGTTFTIKVPLSEQINYSNAI